jgi:hypothetical protein
VGSDILKPESKTITYIDEEQMLVVKLANIGTDPCGHCPRVDVKFSPRILFGKDIVVVESDREGDTTF